jgi:hypothetical protein
VGMHKNESNSLKRKSYSEQKEKEDRKLQQCTGTKKEIPAKNKKRRR